MDIKQPTRVILALITVLVIIQIANSLTQGLISSFGVYPRTLNGLIGIPLAPWIHHDWNHLLSNSAPLAVLSFIVLQQGIKRFVLAYLFISLLAGLAVWLFASDGYHAGASTMIFGLIGYVISNALFSRNILNIILACIICFLYSGAIFSLIEVVPGISWSSHFFGACAGLIVGRILTQSRKKNKT